MAHTHMWVQLAIMIHQLDLGPECMTMTSPLFLFVPNLKMSCFFLIYVYVKRHGISITTSIIDFMMIIVEVIMVDVVNG